MTTEPMDLDTIEAKAKGDVTARHRTNTLALVAEVRRLRAEVVNALDNYITMSFRRTEEEDGGAANTLAVRAQVEAMCRLLVDAGDMTPVASRQILKVIDATQPVPETVRDRANRE